MVSGAQGTTFQDATLDMPSFGMEGTASADKQFNIISPPISMVGNTISPAPSLQWNPGVSRSVNYPAHMLAQPPAHMQQPQHGFMPPPASNAPSVVSEGSVHSVNWGLTVDLTQFHRRLQEQLITVEQRPRAPAPPLQEQLSAVGRPRPTPPPPPPPSQPLEEEMPDPWTPSGESWHARAIQRLPACAETPAAPTPLTAFSQASPGSGRGAWQAFQCDRTGIPWWYHEETKRHFFTSTGSSTPGGEELGHSEWKPYRSVEHGDSKWWYNSETKEHFFEATGLPTPPTHTQMGIGSTPEHRPQQPQEIAATDDVGGGGYIFGPEEEC